jgi:hypothetical protein
MGKEAVELYLQRKAEALHHSLQINLQKKRRIFHQIRKLQTKPGRNSIKEACLVRIPQKVQAHQYLTGKATAFYHAVMLDFTEKQISFFGNLVIDLL